MKTNKLCTGKIAFFRIVPRINIFFLLYSERTRTITAYSRRFLDISKTIMLSSIYIKKIYMYIHFGVYIFRSIRVVTYAYGFLFALHVIHIMCTTAAVYLFDIIIHRVLWKIKNSIIYYVMKFSTFLKVCIYIYFFFFLSHA